MISDIRNPIVAMVLSKALAKSEHLDEKQTSRSMIAALMLGNPLLSILLVRSMNPDKDGSKGAVVFPDKDAAKQTSQQASKS